MITLDDGTIINNLYEAYLWLKEAWIYEPYNIYYEEFGKKGTEEYSECIVVEPTRDNYDDYTHDIFTLEDFKTFIR